MGYYAKYPCQYAFMNDSLQHAVPPAKKTTKIQRCRQILNFWHKVEFFIPYDLEGQILEHQDKDWAVRRVMPKQWASIDLQSHGDLWDASGIPSGRRLNGFELYLGIFDKSLLSNIVKETLKSTPSEVEDIDNFERGDLEGLTCFAKIFLNQHAEPQMDRVSVSTVPWALGRLRKVGIKGLDFDAYEADFQSLKNDLANFPSQRQKQRSGNPLESSGAVVRSPLVRGDIDRLQQIFYTWAGFEPEGNELPVAVIRTVAHPGKEGKDKTTELNAGDEDDDVDEENEPDILNSFFAKDIQRILGVLSRQHARSPLVHYLTPLPEAVRTDLYTNTGREKIRAALHPTKMPSGHWLSQPDHAMSLMQQFAINQIFEALQNGGVFSVNGPPGTGKTTMLRDIFAENVTQRARVLVDLQHSSAAFQTGPKITVVIQKKNKSETRSVSLLIPKLTGFEMLVASSNNAAVENISRDLPKTSALGKLKEHQTEEIAWRHSDGTPKATYLQTVAAKYAARNKRGTFDPLDADKSPWALISCALGNQTNRDLFVKSIAFEKFDGKDGKKIPKGFDPKLHQTIWQWRDCYVGPTFAEARQKFRDADIKLNARQAELIRYVNAIEEIGGLTLEAYAADAIQKTAAAELVWKKQQEIVEANEAKLASNIIVLADLAQLQALTKKPAISLFKWLFNPKMRREHGAAVATYSESIRAYREKQRDALLLKMELETSIGAARNAVVAARIKLQIARDEKSALVAKWSLNKAIIKSLKGEFSRASAPVNPSDLERVAWQQAGVWSDLAINQLRAELFAAALTLHEAWLNEVLQTRGDFGGNLRAVCDLLNGGRLKTPEQALFIWQSLFMVVPVVSTTFASVGRQFKELGPDSLGWLFIDEAGQAVPQAAVGALWRAKRAVVVGDPLQIEPVFTVPAKLIDALAKNSRITEDIRVLPHKYSVQNLADLANRLGTTTRDASHDQQWIGSPLRVHRRCSEPMFEIANAIAYQNKMIFGGENEGKPSPESIDLGCSAWIDIPGPVSNKQVVQKQIDMVVNALVALYIAVGKLPPVYIISPFKRVALTLKAELSDDKRWQILAKGNNSLPSRTELRDWCKEHVGTVHTFQGKQVSIVWFVLGCDDTTRGAVSWASSKPNILNVALTRAEDRVFIIGGAGLWGGQQFFSHVTNDLLPRISADEFISRVMAAGGGTHEG
jgi:hypothetical protein